MIKNKKAEEEGLTSNTLGIVLSIVGILLIIGFVYIAITKIIQDNQLESAKELADRMKASIDLIKEGQSGNLTFQGNKDLGKNNWYIAAWSKNNFSKPDKCFFLKSCFCVCKRNFGSRELGCKEKGICREIDVENISIQHFTYNDPTNIRTDPIYNKPLGVIDPGIKILNEIPVPTNLFILEVSKNKNNISLSSYSEEYLKYLSLMNRQFFDISSARRILDAISSELQKMRDENKNARSEIIFKQMNSYKDVVLLGWKKSDSRKPEKCKDKNCIFICQTDPRVKSENSPFLGNAVKDCENGLFIETEEEISIGQILTYGQPGPPTTLIFPYITLNGNKEDRLVLGYMVEGDKKSIYIRREIQE